MLSLGIVCKQPLPSLTRICQFSIFHSQHPRLHYGVGYEPVALGVGVNTIGAEQRIKPFAVTIERLGSVDNGGGGLCAHLEDHLIVRVVPTANSLHIATHPAEYVGAVVVVERTAEEREVTL